MGAHSLLSKSRMVQIVLVIPATMQGVILTAVFTLTNLYHATQSATHALCINLGSGLF